jgi:hypothetical protein
MIFSPNAKMAFIHVPRTGGISIREVLTKVWPDHVAGHYRSNPVWVLHESARDAANIMPDWGSYFSFGFVRNPWDRMVSLWAHQAPNMDFGAWLMLHRNGPSYEVVKPQTDFLYGLDGRPLVSSIGRFETLSHDFPDIIRLQEILPHKNQSQRGDYRQYYTPNLREFVADRYRSDIEAFGYQF